jgi:hypothetical protein
MRNTCHLLAATFLLSVVTIQAQTSDTEGPAPNPNPNRTTGFVADSNGNSYIAIAGQNKVYKLNASGELSVFAGTNTAGFNGDNSAATDAQLSAPWGLYLDTSGNLYIADSGNARIRKVDAGTGVITTVAGNGTAGTEGDGGMATDAQLNTPANVVIDATNNLLIADPAGKRIRSVAGDSGIISTVPLDDGLDPLTAPYGLASDEKGVLFSADTGNVYKFDESKLKKAAAETVTLTPQGVFYAPALRQISFPVVSSPVALAADQVEWIPASCPAPGTNPTGDCVAAARLMVNLQRPPAKSTIAVKAFGASDTVGGWSLDDIQFSTDTGTGTVALRDVTLPIQLDTTFLPVNVDIDIPLTAIRVKVTITGSVQINANLYPFTLSGYLFP